MAKRNAINELNRDNWDDEEELEEVGTFKKATAEELQKRVIKRAIRRKPGDSGEPQPKSVFTGFSGFKSTTGLPSNAATTETNQSSPFSFLKNITSATSTAAAPMFSFGSNPTSTKPPPATVKNGNQTIEISDDSKSNESSISGNYHAKLKELNQALLKWVTQHVNENPICILSPIFKDYEAHLKTIQNGNTIAKAADKSTTRASDIPFSSSGTIPSLAAPSNVIPITATSDKPQPSLGNLFSKPSTGLFSFDASKPFSFGSSTSAPAGETEQKTDADDDNDEPPKNDFTPVVESDSKYSKRCKVFIKKENSFSDCGVGTLYLKAVKDSNKTQLLVRADTNLGNILINVLLNSALPVQKKKNNVMMVCLPTPEHKLPPTPILLRVQNEEQAEELLNEIKKCME